MTAGKAAFCGPARILSRACGEGREIRFRIGFRFDHVGLNEVIKARKVKSGINACCRRFNIGFAVRIIQKPVKISIPVKIRMAEVDSAVRGKGNSGEFDLVKPNREAAKKTETS